jgi:predicted AlkP superfamily pyrophosphatase or phosphodiesterase
VILILAPLRLFLASHTTLPSRPLLSNGTHAYRPTTLLVSLDGFRPTYLTSHPHLLSNILSLTSQGMRAESMRPVFPTLTFPNHWAMMTGLYPSSSGIIANDFWDPQEGKEFVYTNTDKSWDAGWWWGEPMWSVVERAGRKAGVVMW